MSKSHAMHLCNIRTVYKSLVKIKCSNCDHVIQPTELFTRYADKLGISNKVGIRYVFCSKCRPLPIEYLGLEGCLYV